MLSIFDRHATRPLTVGLLSGGEILSGRGPRRSGDGWVLGVNFPLCLVYPLQDECVSGKPVCCVLVEILGHTVSVTLTSPMQKGPRSKKLYLRQYMSL